VNSVTDTNKKGDDDFNFEATGDKPSGNKKQEPPKYQPSYSHHIEEPEINPAKWLSVLTDAMGIAPFDPTTFTPSKEKMKVDAQFKHCGRRAFYNIHHVTQEGVDLQQIVGFKYPLPDPGIAFVDVIDQWNAAFEDFLCGSLEEHKVTRLDYKLLSAINGRVITIHEFTNGLDINEIILPDLRTIKPRKSEDRVGQMYDEIEETFPVFETVDPDEAARLIEAQEASEEAFRDGDVIDGGEF
jgi:hypothetical protein